MFGIGMMRRGLAMRWLFLFFALSSGASLADDAAPVKPDTTPVAIGRHTCVEYLRRFAALERPGLRTVYAEFRVAVDGSVKDIVIPQSTDDEIADGMAKECI